MGIVPSWRGLARRVAWPRLRFVLIFSGAIGYLPDLVIASGQPFFVYRAVGMGFAGLMTFGLLERWPRGLPRPLPRWVLQVVGVAFAMPLTAFALWFLTTPRGAPPFWRVEDRLLEFAFVSVVGLLLAPWTTLAALLRQKEAFARDQALAFDLERSELERQALDARLHLLQAQVAPHFLFNTLANVQALVEAGSPRAAEVLRSLIAYLRAAVPRLGEPGATMDQELQRVRAYLELMHLRMPDRLQFALHVDDATLSLRCPPLTLLTLVENAVRHGIDPSEEGGRIDIAVEQRAGRCLVTVTDTGVGLQETSRGLGAGLSTLRERLDLNFARAAELRVSEREPHGVCAEVSFPAEGIGA